MKILLDPAHGLSTSGKRSPDGTLLEATYTREIAQLTLAQLQANGHDAHCTALGKTNVILISIHINAAGDGTQWMNATGWSVYTCKGQTASDKLADCLYESAINNFPGQKIRIDLSDGDMDWEENFDLLRKSFCPDVLTENFFMDSHSDLEYPQSM